MHTHEKQIIAAAMFIGVLPSMAVAQFREVPPPPAYALENVTIVHADGRQDVGVNIVVRNGLIESIGATVPIPPDALVLEGDSLVVYPGLVDASAAAEIAFPEIERGDSVRSWRAPRDVQGFLAHRRVADHLDEGAESGKDSRAKGIVAAGVHPEGGLAAGLGVAIVHRTRAQRPWELIVNDNVGLSMSFRGGQGVYPGTPFGVIAYMRQAFEDAKRDALLRAAHSDDPGSLALPAFDPDYAVLQQAMARAFPVFFWADGAEDIRRVLALADEFGFSPVIVGGHEAWRVADQLASRGIAVIIDGDFPEPRDWKPESQDSVARADSIAQPDAVRPTVPLEPDAAREKERIENIRANAGRLAAAGVRFAISSGNGDGDLLVAARLSIQYGLSDSIALQAVTTVPAELLGISSITRIARGLAATFVATTGRLFDEATEIAHTFVEGGYERGAMGAGGGDAPAVNVTGDWTFTLSSGGMDFEMDVTLNMDPNGSFNGTVTNDQFGTAPIRGRVSGNEMNFTITLSFGGQEFEVTGQGTLEGDRLSGSGDSPMGSFTLSGRKGPGGAR